MSVAVNVDSKRRPEIKALYYEQYLKIRFVLLNINEMIIVIGP